MDKITRKQQGTGDKILAFFLNNKALFLLVLLGIAAQILTGGKFLTLGNLGGISRQISVSAIMGIGFTVLLAAGQIDLSVGAMLSFVGILYGIYSFLVPIYLAIPMAIATGAACGFFNGYITRIFRLPGFVLTLAMAQVYKGFAYLLCDGKSIAGLSSEVKYFGQGLIFNAIPVSTVLMLVLLVIFAVMLNKTKFGRHLIATGGNGEAASVSGINVKWIRIAAYMVAGICVSIAAVVMSGRVATSLPNAGEGTEMDAIAAVVIGGTPLHGGKAKVVGTLFGVLLIGVIGNMLNLTNVSPFWQWVSKGVIIVIAIILDSLTEAFFSKRREVA